MNCLAHLLNLVVKLLFSSDFATQLLSKCRKLVGTFKHSTTMSAKLVEAIKCDNRIENPIVNDVDLDPLYLDEEDVQECLQQAAEDDEPQDEATTCVQNKNFKTKLIQDMAVRWNSTLAMLLRLVEFSPYIR